MLSRELPDTLLTPDESFIITTISPDR